MEDVEGTLAIAKLDPEALACPLVSYRDDQSIVTLSPEQPHVDPVVRAVVELAKWRVHRLRGTGGHLTPIMHPTACRRNEPIGSSVVQALERSPRRYASPR
jgi:hypothetical protein